MATFGTIGYADNQFWLEVPPYVAMRLKGVIPRIRTAASKRITLSVSPVACADLRWFMQRYPLKMVDGAKDKLADGQRQFRKAQADVLNVLSGKLKPKPVNLGLKPRDYQVTGIEIMRRRRAVLLTDEMGLGKTLQGLGVAADAAAQPAVVVVKPDLARQWLNQVSLVLPGATTHHIKVKKLYTLPPAQVYVIAYTVLESWAGTLGEFANTVIFDEMQQLRHAATGKYAGATRLCQDIAARNGWRLGLTGSPVYNYGGEIFNILELLEPGALGSYEEFSREWCSGHSSNGQLIVDQPNALGQYLYNQGLMVGRTRQQVAIELPPRTKMVEVVDADIGARMLAVNDTLQVARSVLRGATFMERGQAARELDWKLRQATGVAKAPIVAEYAKLFLEKGESVIIFGWHREFWSILEHELKSYSPVFYTGTESPSQKAEHARMFMAGEAKVMCVSLRSSEGMDGLQAVCQTVIHGELDWSPKVHEQGFTRVYRPGQEKACLELFIVANGGSDPVVAEVNGLKRAQADGITRPDGQDSPLSTEGIGRIKRLAVEYLRQHGQHAEDYEVTEEGTLPDQVDQRGPSPSMVIGSPDSSNM